MKDLSVDKNVLTYLQDFGLNDKEIIIYLSLLKYGPNTIMDLARKTEIKRSTTHNNVEELIKKGLVSQTNYGERRMVIAEDPDKLKFLLEQRKWEVSKLERSMDQIVSEILQVVPKAKENSEVEAKYYIGKEGTSLIYKEAFLAKELRSYVNLAAVAGVFPENSELFLKIQNKNRSKLMVKEIIDGSLESAEIAKKFKTHANFQFKSAFQKLNLSAIDILIYSNKVAFVNFKDNTVTGTVITNKDYYENSVAIFEFIWGII